MLFLGESFLRKLLIARTWNHKRTTETLFCIYFFKEKQPHMQAEPSASLNSLTSQETLGLLGCGILSNS